MRSSDPLLLTSSSRLLVVDSDPATGTELIRCLRETQGFQVDVVTGVSEACRRLMDRPYNAVLLDAGLPETKEGPCLSLIRDLFSAADLPVILRIRMASAAVTRTALLQGANDVVTYQESPDVVISRLKTHLQLQQTRQALRESEERYALAARGSNDGLWDWNLDSGEVYFSPRWKAMLGCQAASLHGRPDEWFERVHPEDRLRFREMFSDQQTAAVTHLEREVRMLHQDGGYRWMLCRGVCVRNAEGRVYRMAGSLTDITEGKVGDPLTGLPNRLLFVDRLERTIERTRRLGEGCFAVLFLDLDNFKQINDRYGHPAGDQLLVEIARRLELSIRSADNVSRCECSTTVARHAGDEFTILLESLTARDDAALVADRVLEAFRSPVQLGDDQIFATFSIGLAVGDRSTVCAEDLMREADTAMYHAKSEGRNRQRTFEGSMQQRAGERQALKQDLWRALQDNEFTLQFQPIVSLHKLQITGFETLVRWQHPQKGLISPLAFIGTAEEMGLMIPLGWWILENACEQAALWQTQFPQCLGTTVNVNCSRGQLCQPDFLNRLSDILIRTGVNPGGICIEITESAVMERLETVETVMSGLHTLGVRVSLDDFGTGFCSLPGLHRFPLSALKIDQTLVQGIQESPKTVEVVRTIIDLAHRLKLQVIAEGIETEQQWTTLAEHGATHGQGFLFSPPVGASYATSFLRDYLGGTLFTGVARKPGEPSSGVLSRQRPVLRPTPER